MLHWICHFRIEQRTSAFKELEVNLACISTCCLSCLHTPFANIFFEWPQLWPNYDCFNGVCPIGGARIPLELGWELWVDLKTLVGNTIWKSTTYEMYVLDLQWIIAAVLFECCFAGNVNWSGCIDLPNKAHKSRCSFGRLYIKLAVITSDGKKGVYYSGLFYVGVIFTLTLSSRWLPRPRCSR